MLHSGPSAHVLRKVPGQAGVPARTAAPAAGGHLHTATAVIVHGTQPCAAGQGQWRSL